MSDDGYTVQQMLDNGYAIFDPPSQRDPTRGEPQERYFAVVGRKPASAEGDPMVEAYWRGTAEEAEDALHEYLSQRVSSDD